MGARRGLVTFVLVSLPFAQVARAQEPRNGEDPSQASPTVEDPTLKRAESLFHDANELMEAGKHAEAAVRFLKVRELAPHIRYAVQNAALCFDALKQHDRALELYEELLAKFRQRLSSSERVFAELRIQELAARLGSLEVEGNVPGLLLIDGQPRGKLPLTRPVHVLPGTHMVRVLETGYDPYETTVQIGAGQRRKVKAELSLLAAVGRVRVEGDSLEGGTVWIDGAPVGAVPWEGPLAPGRHVVLVLRGDEGTAPQSILIIEKQTALVSVEPKRLGPEIEIVVEPATASVHVDGAALGARAWRGRLPLGTHRVEAREAGYRTRLISLQVTPEMKSQLRIELAADPGHPRWGARRGRAWIELRGGYAGADSLGAETAGTVVAASNAAGFSAGGVVGYETSFGLSGWLGGGFIALSQHVSRRFGGSYEVRNTATDETMLIDATHRFDHAFSWSGPYAVVGAGYTLRLSVIEAALRLGLAGILSTSADDVTGVVAAGTASAPTATPRSSVETATLVAWPELRVGARFAAWSAGITFTGAIILTDGNRRKTRTTRVNDQCNSEQPGVGCLPAVELLGDERSHGQFFLGLPSLYLSYSLDL